MCFQECWPLSFWFAWVNMVSGQVVTGRLTYEYATWICWCKGTVFALFMLGKRNMGTWLTPYKCNGYILTLISCWNTDFFARAGSSSCCTWSQASNLVKETRGGQEHCSDLISWLMDQKHEMEEIMHSILPNWRSFHRKKDEFEERLLYIREMG